jgi:fumarate hydratase class II
LDTTQAAAISKEAHATGRTIREVARQWGVLPDEEIDTLLDFLKMTQPGVPGRSG